MASADQRAGVPDGLRADGLRVAVIATRWNPDIVGRLAEGAHTIATELGAVVRIHRVAGALELPLAAKYIADAGLADAIVVVGAVIRGETTHYDLVSEGCAEGVMRVQLDTGVPIGFGVATVENEAQAVARSAPVNDPGGHNVGVDATVAALELASLRRRL